MSVYIYYILEQMGASHRDLEGVSTLFIIDLFRSAGVSPRSFTFIPSSIFDFFLNENIANRLPKNLFMDLGMNMDKLGEILCLIMGNLDDRSKFKNYFWRTPICTKICDKFH